MKKDNPVKCDKRKPYGFTLAELLIALLILGVIATFTIPKVLQSQQSSHWNSSAKEVAGMLSEGYQVLRSQNSNPYLQALDLTPYFNYVSANITTTVDSEFGSGMVPVCGTNVNCLKLHNGGVLWYEDTSGMCDTPPTAVRYHFDPDGVRTGDEVISFYVYSTGALKTAATRLNGTQMGVNGTAPCTAGPWGPLGDPPWFSWN